MPAFDNAILRTGTLGTDTDPLVPEPLVAEVIKEATKVSAVLSNVRPVRMAAGTSRQPVLGVKPTAYWGSGDTSLSPTTNVEWVDIDLVAEPLTVVVPIPKAYLNDALVNVWDEVRPELSEAIARKIDAACLFGVDSPNTFGKSIFESADDAENVITAGTHEDIGVDLARLGKLIKSQGYAVGSFLAEPGFDFDLYGIRSAEGVPIYQPLTDSPGGRILGRQVTEVANGAWDSTLATYLAVDWSKCRLGIRQDVTFEVSDQSVITDASGAIVYNLWQQNMVGLKLYARYAWQVAKPVTALQDSASLRSPFGILEPVVTT